MESHVYSSYPSAYNTAPTYDSSSFIDSLTNTSERAAALASSVSDLITFSTALSNSTTSGPSSTLANASSAFSSSFYLPEADNISMASGDDNLSSQYGQSGPSRYSYAHMNTNSTGNPSFLTSNIKDEPSSPTIKTESAESTQNNSPTHMNISSGTDLSRQVVVSM